ncbi:MAG: peptide chain release factor N(5)-glutamine methyltransferase [Paramuribaculum sp.]|nr:peptide chain release factor N(5)-glutamine methyltransferase [Paramuribaculum sp.]
MTLREITRNAITRLTPLYGSGEAQWLMRLIWYHIKGYSQTDTILKAADEVSDFIAWKIDAVIDRLMNHEPIQYIFGTTTFYGLTIGVNPSVLIPRPETEQLVETIINQANRKADLRVLDICTGSGCIALALARNLLFPTVTATDISPEALATARENARALRVKVDFHESDILSSTPLPSDSFDIIVSNPPYIAEEERKDMSSNVLDYEPHLALFVPDNDPLLFYRAIAAKATSALTAGGKLYFEINPRFHSQLVKLLEQDGFSRITVIRDSFGAQRFITAVNPR